jgi:hypothetical protein
MIGQTYNLKLCTCKWYILEFAWRDCRKSQKYVSHINLSPGRNLNSKRWLFQEPHGATSLKMAFFICADVYKITRLTTTELSGPVIEHWAWNIWDAVDFVANEVNCTYFDSDVSPERVVDPLGRPSSPLQITFTRAPLDREIKKSEKKASPTASASFPSPFHWCHRCVHISVGVTEERSCRLLLKGRWQRKLCTQAEGNVLLRT